MPRSLIRIALLLAILTLASGALPLTALAQEATPVASPAARETAGPPIGARTVAPDEACDPAQFPAGEAGITFQPEEDFGYVSPAEAPDHNLYLTVDSMPPDTCNVFAPGTFGAATFLVLEGTIEFLAWPAGPDDVAIQAGTASGDAVSVPAGAPVTLATGDWATVDRRADFAYRNPGPGEATVVMAIYEQVAVRANGCAGGCRRR